jgi:ABC-type bacteriocin/lantibiotic exporter with double-glycine peptidase domain
MSSERQRNKRITRQIHRLFWRGNLVNPTTFILWLLMRPPAQFIYNILIPIQVAYALQAIVTRQFDTIGHFVLVIMLLAVAYGILWALGGVAICKNGETGAAYIQKEVFANYLKKDYEFYNTTYLGALSSQAVRLREAFNEYNQVMINAMPLQFIVVVSSIGVIAYHSIVLALVTLVCMGFVLSFTLASSRWRLKYRRKLSEASSELAGVVGDALGQGTTVKSFAAEAYENSVLMERSACGPSGSIGRG